MRVPSLEAFCIMLQRLAYTTRLSVLSMYYGRSPGVLSRIINRMYEVIYAQLHPLLHWDHRRLTVDKLKEYAQTIFENGGEQVRVAEGIFGFIDGTVRKIARPTFNQEIFYSGWK